MLISPRHVRGIQGLQTPLAAKSSCFGGKATPELNFDSGTGFQHHIAIRTLAHLHGEVGGNRAHEAVDVTFMEYAADPQAPHALIRDDDLPRPVAVHPL